MQIVVTGSQSFIGRRFIATVRRAGISVVGVDTIAGDPGDIVMDIRDHRLASVIPPGCDSVVHLAAISRDGDCRSDPRAAFDVNVTGTLNVVAACRERGVPQLVFASSEWVYAEASAVPSFEDDTIDIAKLRGEYGLTKITAERALALACPRDIPNVTVLRFGIVYGPRPANWSAVESLFNKVASEAVISVGSLATARRFVHVDDIGSGILAALGRTGGFEIFNLSGNTLVTLADVIETSRSICGTQPAIVETQPAAGNVRNPENRKAREVLRWRPEVDLEQGLRSLRESSTLAPAP